MAFIYVYKTIKKQKGKNKRKVENLIKSSCSHQE